MLENMIDWIDNVTEVLFICWLPVWIQRIYYSQVWIDNGKLNNDALYKFVRMINKYPGYLRRRIRLMTNEEIELMQTYLKRRAKQLEQQVKELKGET